MVYELGKTPEETPEFQDQLYGLPLQQSGAVSEDLEHSEGFSSDKPVLYGNTGRIFSPGVAERTDLSNPDEPLFDM